MDIEKLPIESISFDPANARKHSERNIEAIKGSLVKFGQRKPIVVRNNIVIAGNGTLAAAKKLNWETIDVVRADDMTPTEAIAFAIADNKTSELAEWDHDVLNLTLTSLLDEGFELEEIGFELDELPGTGLSEPSEKDDEIPEVEHNVHKVELGDIWQLGEHRLMCGDSTVKENVEKLMDGRKLDITFTSPPYNVGSFGYDDGKSKYKVKGGDNLKQKEYFDFLKKFTDLSLEYSNMIFLNNQFLWGNRKALAKFIGHYSDNLKEVFPWIKNTAPPNVNKGVFTNRFEIFLCLENNNSKRGFEEQWQGKYHNIIEGSTSANENISKGTHSATMPLYVPEWFIERLSFIKSIYEPFCGTGTTLIACEKTNRKCYGMELDPHYCSVIIERWQNFTGKKAEKLG